MYILVLGSPTAWREEGEELKAAFGDQLGILFYCELSTNNIKQPPKAKAVWSGPEGAVWE